MNWKDIIIGSIATLLVTILGGVGVYYFTKEPAEKNEAILTYSTDETANFKGGETSVAFTNYKIFNQGNRPSENIIVSIKYPSATIKDYSIESATGVKAASVQVDKNTAIIKFSSLLPSENVNISLLLSKKETPEFSAKSSLSLAKPLQYAGSSGESPKVAINKFTEFFMPLFAVIAVIMSYFLSRKIKKGSHPSTNKNNMAFLLFHQGEFDNAKEILDSCIKNGDDGSYALSNLAACEAHLGNLQRSNILITAAEFFAHSKREKSIVFFNKSIISLIGGDDTGFISNLKLAVELEPDDIKRYCDYSSIFNSVRNDVAYKNALSGN